MTPAPGASAPAAAVPAVPAVPAAAAEPSTELVALQKTNDELKEQVAEGQRTAQYWADKAKGAAPAKAAEPEDDTDVLEAITTGGAKGFDALAKKRGFMQRDEVELLINQKAAGLTEEQQLITDYPDLKKKDSEFFLATARTYGDLVKGGMKEATAMGTAARQTELAFIKSGKIKLPGSETAAEKETARLARIAAQSGDGGGRRPGAASEDDDSVSPDEELAIKRLAEALEIPLDKAAERYKARAKKGVQVGLRMGK